jgi:hypothetical protein
MHVSQEGGTLDIETCGGKFRIEFTITETSPVQTVLLLSVTEKL